MGGWGWGYSLSPFLSPVVVVSGVGFGWGFANFKFPKIEFPTQTGDSLGSELKGIVKTHQFQARLAFAAHPRKKCLGASFLG